VHLFDIVDVVIAVVCLVILLYTEVMHEKYWLSHKILEKLFLWLL